jgi:hypothetical protein
MGDRWKVSPAQRCKAIANVFLLAVRQNLAIAGLNPLALWDIHFVRELDDSGYIDRRTNKKGGATLRLFRSFS